MDQFHHVSAAFLKLEKGFICYIQFCSVFSINVLARLLIDLLNLVILIYVLFY